RNSDLLPRPSLTPRVRNLRSIRAAMPLTLGSPTGRSHPMTRKDAGLSLIELLTTLAIAAVTLTVGLPAFSGSLERTRVSTTMHRVSADLAMARSSAIMRRAQVVVCPRTPDLRCRDDRDWSHGWIVFTDDDGNRQPDEDAHIL